MINFPPDQKEPKLARARQIPEWEEYDSEIAQLSRSLAAEGKIRSGMATADANMLAGGATNGVSDGKDKSQGSAVADRSEDPEVKSVKEDDSEGIERTRNEL